MISMKIGDVIFVYDNSLLSKLIRFFDHNGKFSHCCICVSDNNDILEAQYSTRSQIIPFPYQEYEIIDLGLSDSQKEKIQKLAPKLVGYSYNFLEIISIFIKNVFDKKFKIFHTPKQLICSELVEILLQDINAIPSEISLRDKTPNELYEYLKSLQGR